MAAACFPVPRYLPHGSMTMNADRDRHFAALMRSVQNGDRSAYALLLRELAPLLRYALRRRYHFALQPADIEDLVQEVLLSLHVARATYAPTRPFLPWLMAITHNRAADFGRRGARRARDEAVFEDLSETFSAASANLTEGVYGDPDALRNAIQALPRGQRDAVVLLKLRELSLKEASNASGMSVGALKVAVHRAIKALRLSLRKEA